METNFRCNCGKATETQQQLIDHYKAEHPDDPWGLWDQIGTIGDPWADMALSVYRERLGRALQKNDEYYGKAKERDTAVARYNKMVRTFNLISDLMAIAGESTD